MARSTSCAAALALLAALVIAGGGSARTAGTADTGARHTDACPPGRAQKGETARVLEALRSRRDLWGDGLLASPGGPTYAAARRILEPLLYAYGRGRRPLTSSGVYYLPFAFPRSLYGEKAFALHVADGSEIVTRRVGGMSLSVFVGSRGRERYGACLARLAPARLADGYLPILDTSYVDAHGVRYRQESFAGRVAGASSLVSFVRLDVDARDSAIGAVVRLVPSALDLAGSGDSLVDGSLTQLAFGHGGRFDGSAVRFAIPAGETRELYAAWVHQPTPTAGLTADRPTYAGARAGVARFWSAQLARGVAFEVPEKRVMDAQRSLLIQQLVLTWRYSIGNPYEELSFAEALDAAQVMAGYGFDNVAKAILRFSLKRLPQRFTNWRAGERLLAGATYYRLSGDRASVEEELPELAPVVRVLGRQLDRPGAAGLLAREPYSSDIRRNVLGLHAQAVVWQGLNAMGDVWARTGHRGLAKRSRTLAARLETGLRRAVGTSMRELPDGSLFVPAALLDGGEPFDRLSASREGSYWNLVMPYALASGLFPAHGPAARGLLAYMLAHGSRLLGLVRAGVFQLYGTPPFPVSGTDQVYGVNVSRFLADNDEADQLALSLYGSLAAAMTPETYVSGEGATVAPLADARYRAMYLPPNGGGNASFLETLRLMLVHETRGARGEPRGLELAFATPRAWLRPGQAIRVERAPTSFGSVSYSIERRGRAIRIAVDRPTGIEARLRLRLPAGERIASVRRAGRQIPIDAATETIDLTAVRRLDLTAVVTRG